MSFGLLHARGGLVPYASVCACPGDLLHARVGLFPNVSPKGALTMTACVVAHLACFAVPVPFVSFPPSCALINHPLKQHRAAHACLPCHAPTTSELDTCLASASRGPSRGRMALCSSTRSHGRHMLRRLAVWKIALEKARIWCAIPPAFPPGRTFRACSFPSVALSPQQHSLLSRFTQKHDCDTEARGQRAAMQLAHCCKAARLGHAASSLLRFRSPLGRGRGTCRRVASPTRTPRGESVRCTVHARGSLGRM